MRKKVIGLTLIEFIMVTMILSIMATVVAMLYAQALTTATTVKGTTNAVWQSQIAMQRMIRDIHQVRSANDVATMTASTFAFTDITGASVTYTKSGTTLTRNGIVLANGVHALSFAYRDKNNVAVSSALNLAYVRISLTTTENNTHFQSVSAAYLRDLSS